jgi:hypothetical protein
MEQSDQIYVSAFLCLEKGNLFPPPPQPLHRYLMDLRHIWTLWWGYQYPLWELNLSISALKWLRYHCSFLTLSPLDVTEKYSVSNVSVNIYKMLELECEDTILSFSYKIKIYYISSPLTLSHILINILHIFTYFYH